MEKVIKFIAYDGKAFENENDCFNYEWEQKIKNVNMKEHLKIYDDNKKEITNWSFDTIEQVVFVHFLTLEGMKFFYDWSNEFEIESPFCPYDLENEKWLGFWGWEPFNWWGGWCHLDTIKNNIDELIKELKEKEVN